MSMVLVTQPHLQDSEQDRQSWIKVIWEDSTVSMRL